MAFEVGQNCVLEVRRQADPGLYLGGPEPEDQVLLPRSLVPDGTAIGDRLRVFVYTDSEDRPVATTLTPAATVGDFAFLQVIDVSTHGAFLDWGLEKDLFAPRGEQCKDLEVGDELVFALALDDRTNRVFAASKLNRHLNYEVAHLKAGTEVKLLVYDQNELGYLVVVAGSYSGLIYRNEAFRPLSTGEQLTGFIKLVRSDNKLDIRLQRTGKSAMDDAQQVVLEALLEGNGFIPLTDKSSPEEIRRTLSMSKKAFKRALGGLYKARRVELGPDGTRLKK